MACGGAQDEGVDNLQASEMLGTTTLGVAVDSKFPWALEDTVALLFSKSRVATDADPYENMW
jgi:hypothetical protein